MRTSGTDQLQSIKHQLIHLGDTCGNITVKASEILFLDKKIKDENKKKISAEACQISNLAHNLEDLCREYIIKSRWERTNIIPAAANIAKEIEQITYTSDCIAKFLSNATVTNTAYAAQIIRENANICKKLINYGVESFVRGDVIRADSAEEIGYRIFENSKIAIAEILTTVKNGKSDESSISNLITSISLFNLIGDKALNISRHALDSFKV